MEKDLNANTLYTFVYFTELSTFIREAFKYSSFGPLSFYQKKKHKIDENNNNYQQSHTQRWSQKKIETRKVLFITNYYIW